MIRLHGTCTTMTLSRTCLDAATSVTIRWLVLFACLAGLAGRASRAQDRSGTGPEGPAVEGEGLLRHEPGAFAGYTLLSPLQSRTTYLIDMEGRVVQSWATESTPSSLAYLLENGNLLRAGAQPNPPWGRGAGAGGRVQEFSWDGELVWDFTYFTDTLLPHHDFVRLPNGNVVLVVRERKTAEEAIAAGRVPASVEGIELQVDALIEIKPSGKTTGELVWAWHLWDHLIQDFDTERAHYGEVAAHPELVDVNFGTGFTPAAGNAAAGQPLRQPAANQPNPAGDGRRPNPDWTHVNGVAYNEELDQLMISVYRFSEVWIIDHSTTTAEAAGHTGGRSGKGGDLLYRWGNPRAYRAGTQEDQRLFNPHAAHWIGKRGPGAGHLLVFNNGNGRPGGNYSSVDEIILPVDSRGHYARESGRRFGPQEPLWSYSAPNPPDFYSSSISGASRLPNGNTLICSGRSGAFFEVTPEKQVVWQYTNPSRTAPGRRPAGAPAARGRGGRGGRGTSVFRVYRYAADYPGLAGRDLTPGKPLEEVVRESESAAENRPRQ